jgi:hypothetical protein
MIGFMEFDIGPPNFHQFPYIFFLKQEITKLDSEVQSFY